LIHLVCLPYLALLECLTHRACPSYLSMTLWEGCRVVLCLRGPRCSKPVNQLQTFQLQVGKPKSNWLQWEEELCSLTPTAESRRPAGSPHHLPSSQSCPIQARSMPDSHLAPGAVLKSTAVWSSGAEVTHTLPGLWRTQQQPDLKIRKGWLQVGDGGGEGNFQKGPKSAPRASRKVKTLPAVKQLLGGPPSRF
jgi:hypothetical protein